MSGSISTSVTGSSGIGLLRMFSVTSPSINKFPHLSFTAFVVLRLSLLMVSCTQHVLSFLTNISVLQTVPVKLKLNQSYLFRFQINQPDNLYIKFSLQFQDNKNYLEVSNCSDADGTFNNSSPYNAVFRVLDTRLCYTRHNMAMCSYICHQRATNQTAINKQTV